MKQHILTTLAITLSICLLSANSLSLSDNGDGTWNVNYSSDSTIGGFQFNIEGATVNSASGGDAETAGFSLAALTFLGLSYTFRSGEHIRVTLVTRLLNKEIKRYQELFSLSFSLLITGFLMYWSWDFVYFSFVFDEISPGLLAIPFWIPRISMSIGVTIFFIALLDDIVMVLKNKIPSYVKNADPIFKDNA